MMPKQVKRKSKEFLWRLANLERLADPEAISFWDIATSSIFKILVLYAFYGLYMSALWT